MIGTLSGLAAKSSKNKQNDKPNYIYPPLNMYRGRHRGVLKTAKPQKQNRTNTTSSQEKLSTHQHHDNSLSLRVYLVWFQSSLPYAGLWLAWNACGRGPEVTSKILMNTAWGSLANVC